MSPSALFRAFTALLRDTFACEGQGTKYHCLIQPRMRDTREHYPGKCGTCAYKRTQASLLRYTCVRGRCQCTLPRYTRVSAHTWSVLMYTHVLVIRKARKTDVLCVTVNNSTTQEHKPTRTECIDMLAHTSDSPTSMHAGQHTNSSQQHRRFGNQFAPACLPG